MRVHPEPIRRERAQLWINPILDWSKAQVDDYMEVVSLLSTTYLVLILS